MKIRFNKGILISSIVIISILGTLTIRQLMAYKPINHAKLNGKNQSSDIFYWDNNKYNLVEGEIKRGKLLVKNQHYSVFESLEKETPYEIIVEFPSGNTFKGKIIEFSQQEAINYLLDKTLNQTGIKDFPKENKKIKSNITLGRIEGGKEISVELETVIERSKANEYLISLIETWKRVDGNTGKHIWKYIVNPSQLKEIENSGDLTPQNINVK